MASALRPLRVVLAQPRGFCAGVVRAIEIVEQALAQERGPVFVRHEIVHNRHVVDELTRKGAVFVETLAEVPRDALTIFSAHGVAPAVEREAAQRGLDVIDATCPLVRKVHKEGRRYAELGYDVVLIGHAGHPEVEGTRGQIGEPLHIVATVEEAQAIVVRDPERVAYVTQTTLSVTDTREVIAALKRRFPAIVGPDTRDICYATQNRQVAAAELAMIAELVLVFGSANSSNSNRLREIAAAAGAQARLVDGPDVIDPAWLDGVDTLGITAGASAPETLVTRAIERLATWRAITVETLPGIEETIEFRLPARLNRPAEAVA